MSNNVVAASVNNIPPWQEFIIAPDHFDILSWVPKHMLKGRLEQVLGDQLTHRAKGAAKFLVLLQEGVAIF